MNRKSLIISIIALAVMVIGVAVAVAALYYDPDKKESVEGRYELLQAVPSNAVVAGCLSHVRDVSSDVFAGFKFPAALSDAVSDGLLGTLPEAQMAFSLHYSGKLTPLYIFDAGAAAPTPSSEASALMDFGRSHGLQASYLDCSSVLDGGELALRSLVIMAETDALVKSSIRHLEESLSVLEASGFANVAKAATGSDLIFVSYAQAKPLFTTLFGRKYFSEKYGKSANAAYSAMADFTCSLAEWAVFSVEHSETASTLLKGLQVYADDASDFMSVIAQTQPASSSASDILPSYTYFALTLPMASWDSYQTAYKSYLDSKQKLAEYNRNQTLLADQNGLSPELFVRRLAPKEVAKAAFGSADALHEVNLVKLGKNDTVVFRGTGVTSFKDYVPAVHEFMFPGFIASVFGKWFTLNEETHFTVIDGWLVTGSRDAVAEYASGRALEYSLKGYMADAGSEDLLALKPVSMEAYLNLGVKTDVLPKILNKEIRNVLDFQAKDAQYRPMVMAAVAKGNNVATDLSVYALELQRIKAPEFERDTTVTVPTGPFRVKNSGTGRMNIFYQNSAGAICLKEETGEGIWGVPFGKPLCGVAQTIDYYANGKLQILFGAGSSIYLIDRLGRFVSGFPVDLGKEILIGPEPYDFNGTNAYNVMVLHKDNTIEMYNLKGEKPSSWNGISCEETIKGLPERIIVGGNTFWVVRTSIQTLIYPFAGGDPLTVYEGQKMILPDSRIDIVDHATVQAECYDGQVRTIKLK